MCMIYLGLNISVKVKVGSTAVIRCERERVTLVQVIERGLGLCFITSLSPDAEGGAVETSMRRLCQTRHPFMWWLRRCLFLTTRVSDPFSRGNLGRVQRAFLRGEM